jgi:hypothetical protein
LEIQNSQIDVVYPEWWNIDGTADEVQINKAILCAQTKAYCTVQLQDRIYDVAATIEIDETGYITFQGMGQGTVLRRTTSYGETIQIEPTTPATQFVTNLTLRDMNIVHQTNPAVATDIGIRCHNMVDSFFENLHINNHGVGLKVQAGGRTRFTNIIMYWDTLLGATTASTYGIWVLHGGHATATNAGDMHFVKCQVRGLPTPGSRYLQHCAYLQNGDGVYFDGCHFAGSYNHGVLFSPSNVALPLAGYKFTHCWFDWVGADTATGIGVYFTNATTSAADYKLFDFTGCTWTGDGLSKAQNIYFGAACNANKITVTGCHFGTCMKHSIYFGSADTLDVNVTGNVFFNASYGNAGSWPAIQIATAVNRVNISNNIIGGPDNDAIILSAVAMNDVTILGNTIQNCDDNIISDSNTGVRNAIQTTSCGQIGRIIADIALTAGNANDFAFAWQNPNEEAIMVEKVVIDVTTPGGTVASVLDVDVVANATSTGDDIIDGVDLNATATYDSSCVADDVGGNANQKSIRCDANGGANDYVTGKILVANAASLVGRAYIHYSIIKT